MSKKNIIAPSILSADFRNLEKDVKAAQDAGADWIHCDIMDGRFVPNISFGPMIVAAVKKCVSIPLDVHLMIVHPEEYIVKFREAGADIITVHAEGCNDLPATIKMIRESGAQVGVTVNPDKPISLFLPYLDQIDLVLIMSVYAGFGGQKFIADTMTKVDEVYKESLRIGHEISIEVDGGINADTAEIAARHGANAFVAGNYVFNSNDYAARIEAVRSGAVKGWESR